MDMTKFFGPVIHSYSRAQAIEDGVLADLSRLAPVICREHFKYPVACTAAVWAIIELALRPNRAHANSLTGVLHDVFFMSKMRFRKVDEATRIFQVKIVGAGRKALFQFKVVCGPGDTAEPVLTFMLPEES